MLPDLSQRFTHLGYRLQGFCRGLSRLPGRNEKRLSQARGSRIVLYHGVCPGNPLRFNTLFVKLQTLETQLRLYRQYFNVVSLDDFYSQQFDHDRFTVCLTFDDGFANNYRYVLPLLERYKIPATFFITGVRQAEHDMLWNDFLSIATRCGPSRLVYNDKYYFKSYGRYVSVSNGRALADELRETDFTEKEQLMKSLSLPAGFKDNAVLQDYWMQMNVQQIRQLAASPLVTIGGHGYYHNDLSKIPLTQAREEMSRSKLWLEELTGKGIKALAFPYGSYNIELKEAAKQVGYNQLLGTEFLFPEDKRDKTIKERLTVNPFISPINQLYAVTDGRYE